MTCQEPTGAPKFASSARLSEHVRKHVFGMGQTKDEAEDEGWKKILKCPQLGDALSALRKGQYALPPVLAVEQAYEAYAANTLLKACQEGRDHCHFSVKSVTLNGMQGGLQLNLEEQFEEIILCDRKHGVFLVAATSVSQGGQGLYFLRTTYRPYPALRGEGFLRKAKEKMKRKNRENESSSLLADHTQW